MFDPTTFTGFHTWLSLVALAAGLVVLAGLLRARDRPGWTAGFLAFAVATSVTGFGFPRGTGVTPAQVTGAVALLVLAIALLARYRGLVGLWRLTYAVALVVSEYLLAFVGVAQSFQKVAALGGPAGLAFALVQLAVLLGFIWLGFWVVKRSRREMELIRPVGQAA